jgi:hypothetical protein
MVKNKSEEKQLEVKRKKEYIRFLDSKLYKLKSNQRFLNKKLEQAEKEIKDYEKEKTKTEK